MCLDTATYFRFFLPMWFDCTAKGKENSIKSNQFKFLKGTIELSYNVFKLDGKDFIIPEEDTQSQRYYFQMNTERECLEAPLEYVKNKNVVVQAGGNLGFFPHFYAKEFKTVYTFEPDPRSFNCLARNVPEENVIKINMALSEKTGKWVDILSNKEHIGMTRLHPEKTGIIPTIALDDMNLPECDLIQYDMEGYELFALRGSIKTIKRFMPVISIEKYGHSKKYNVEENELDNLLVNELGYKQVKKVYGDYIYIPN